MMPLFILSICFSSLKKFLSYLSSRIPRSHRMNVVTIIMLLFVLMVGCMGSDPQGTNLSDEDKNKIFDAFNKTALYGGDHAKRMKYQWNQENPSQKQPDHGKLYKQALSVIDGKCKECELLTGTNRKESRAILTNIHKKVAEGTFQDRQLMHETLRKDYPKFQPVGEDLTWSLVHDWYQWYCKHGVQDNLSHWTEGMKACLLHIREKASEEGRDSKNDIRGRWKLLYPDIHIRASTLQTYGNHIKCRGCQPNKKAMKNMKERYDSVFSQNKEKEKVRTWKWTPGMKTDLLYIASQFHAKDRLFGLKIKTQWDQMNHPYEFMSEKYLMKRLSRLINENFRLRPFEAAQTKGRYDKLSPINEDVLSKMKRNIISKDVRNWAVQKDFREKLTKILEEYKESFNQLLAKPSSHDVSDHDKGNSHSSSDHVHSDHSSEEETPALYGNYEPELTPNLNALTQSSSRSLGYGHSSGYEIHHFPNVSRHGKEVLPPTPRTSRRSRLGEGGSSATQEYHQPGHMQNLTDLIYSQTSFPEYGNTFGYEMHHYPNISGHDTAGGSSASQHYQQPELTQDLSAPVYSPQDFTRYENTSHYDMYLPSIITGDETGSLSPTSHTSHGSHHQEVGGSSAPYEYQQPVLTQNLTAPIHSPERFPEYGSWAGYGMHIPPISTVHDTGSPLSTPRTPHRSHRREVSQEYHQPGFHSPRVGTEFRLPPGYSTQTLSSDPVFEPQSHSPRPRRRGGSSTPRVRRRPPQE